jgi:cell division protein FtsQ
MDGGRRLAEPLKRARQSGRKGPAGAGVRRQRHAGRQRSHRLRRFAEFTASHTASPVGRLLQRALQPLVKLHLPRGTGIAASALLIGASLVYGSVAGGHVAVITGQLADLRDAGANAVGFNIASVALTGQNQISREDILTAAGITGRTSLLFLDAEAARRELKKNPWIAEATVLKLYPDSLQIGVTERQAFALWQKNGQLSVIAEDGTVLEPYVARRFTGLPLVVGEGAQGRAKEILNLIGRYPEIAASVGAAVLVAQRRWNLRLKNGVDVRLPESGMERALATLVDLDREKKLLSRDITAVDLRLPDRVTVRLSDESGQAREEALKPKAKRKGGAV